jgi:glutathione S-transferase
MEQGVVDMWLRRIELNLMTPVGMVWIHGSPLTKGVVHHQIGEVADQYRAVVNAYYGFLDEQLATREYIAGDSYSIADIVALCTLDFASRLNELPHSPEQQHLTRWHESVSSRPSSSA